MDGPNPNRTAAHQVNRTPVTPVYATLTTALATVAREEPDRLYVGFLDSKGQEQPLTFGETWQRACAWATALEDRGARGERVAILLPTGPDFLAAFFGTLLGGGTPVPLAYPLAIGRADAYVLGLAPILRNARPRLLVTNDVYAATMRQLAQGCGATAVLLPEELGTARQGSWAELDPDGPALLQYTSGPVHEPHGVLLTHRQVLANVFGLGAALRLTRDDVALTWIPLVHDMGLIGGLFTSLYWRCPLWVMPPQAFLMRPHEWLQQIARRRVTLSVAPNFAYQLCVRRVREKHLENLDLSAWRLALDGAETVQPATLAAFAEKLAPAGFSSRALLPTYGLAENTLATACPPLDVEYVETQPPDGGAPVVSLGSPLAGQTLAIHGPNDTLLAEKEVGEIVVSGPCVMQGYFDRAEATARVLRDGSLHTGDLGFIDQGRLFFAGRRKQMVIKMGRNYYPGDVERVVGAALGHDRLVAFARPNAESGTEDLVVLAEHAPLTPEGQKELVTQLNGDLLAQLGLRAEEIRPLHPGTLPIGLPKPEQRLAMALLLSEGRLP